MLTFAHDGAYGHPDHIAICQFSTAAIVSAARSSLEDKSSDPHAVSKLYYLAWGPETWEAYQRAFKKLTSTVDGEVREASRWPEWSITTRIDAREYWPTVWRAIQCYKTQLPGYPGLADVSDEQHENLWGLQSYYRVFSSANGGHNRGGGGCAPQGDCDPGTGATRSQAVPLKPVRVAAVSRPPCIEPKARKRRILRPGDRTHVDPPGPIEVSA